MYGQGILIILYGLYNHIKFEMKKVLSYIVTAAIISCLPSIVFTQDISLAPKNSRMAFSTTENSHSTAVPYINNVNGKVLKSFYRSFGDQPGAKWFQSGKGYTVFFKDSFMSANIYFKRNGTIEYRIYTYSEDILANSVRHIVKTHFYDYAIILVTEVHKNESKSFFVKVEDNTTIKTVKVEGEEWEVVEELKKQVQAKL